MIPPRSMLYALLACCWHADLYAADFNCRPDVMPPAVHRGKELRVATLNIAHGRGSAINQMLIGRDRIEANLQRVAAALDDAGAQLVALQELDVASRWSGNFDHADVLLKASQLGCATLGLHAENWLYRFGTGLLSSVTLYDPRATAFEPTPPTTTKGLIAATLHWDSGQGLRRVRVASVHLDFSRKGVRQRQLQRVIDATRASALPVIVMGDFNEQWHSSDSLVRHLVEEAGLVAYEPDSMVQATYNSKRLDWILVSSDLEFVDYHVVNDELSDHRLVVTTLRWKDT